MRPFLLRASLVPLIAVVHTRVFAQPVARDRVPTRLTLADAVQLALQQNPAILAARARHDEQDAQLRAAKGKRLLRVDNSVALTANPNRSAAVLPGALFGAGSGPQVVRLGSAVESNATTTIRLPVLDESRRRAVDVARADRDVADATLARVTDDVVFRVRDAYAAVAEARASRVAAHAVAQWRRIEATTRASLVQVGRTETSVGSSALVDAEDAALSVERASAAERSARARLAAVLGFDPGQVAARDVLEPVDDLGNLVAEVTVDSTPPSAAPPLVVREAAAAEAAARARLQAERATRWPSLSLVGTSAWLGFAESLGDLARSRSQFQRTAVGVELSWPRFDSGVRNAEVRAFDAAWRQAVAQRQSVELDVAASRVVAAQERDLVRRELRVVERRRATARERFLLIQASVRAGRTLDEEEAHEAARCAEADVQLARTLRAFLRADADLRRLGGRPEPTTATTPLVVGGTR